MNSMTAGQNKEHPGVVAMRAHVEVLESNIHYFRRSADAGDEERELERRIAALHAELDALRVRRQTAIEKMEAKEAELVQARKTLAECEVKPAVAQLMWLKLLMERREPRKQK